MSQAPVTQQRARFTVKTPTGMEVQLLASREKKYYEEARDKYFSEYAFTMANDHRSLDRLLLLEVQMFRAQWMLAAGADYDAVDLEPAEEKALRAAIKDLNNQINELQRELGLTKAQRDKDAQADNVGAYLMKLKLAAKEHGIRRDRQVAKAIELSMELFAMAGAYSRSNDTERKKLGFESAEDIVTWVLDYMQPEFDEVDKAYRKNQKMWVREL